MALTTNGLINGGVTAHYSFSYDDSFAGPGGQEPGRTNAVIAACESDYNVMSGWFGGGLNVTGMTVQVTPTNGVGASWSGSSTSSTIVLQDAQGTSYRFNPAYLRYLLIAEVTEIFMMTQNIGWFHGGNEGSKGEGLSRFLSSQFLLQNGFLGLDIDADFSVADLWLNSPRQDFVNNDPDDNGYDATNGCTTLFIYYLFHQLGFTINQIVAAGASTLAAVYTNLTGDAGDPFPLFKRLLDNTFPSQTDSAVSGPNFDDPWPLGILSFIVDKSSFGKDEVNDVVNTAGGQFPDAFWLLLEGFSQRGLAGATPTLSGPAFNLNVDGVTTPLDMSGTEFERPGDQLAPQRILFPFDMDFTSASLSIFPAPASAPIEGLLNGSITVLGAAFNAATVLELLSGADPYFTNVDPIQNNAAYLSQDLRVFTATPGVNNTPVTGGPIFGTDSFDGAYSYTQALLTYLNGNFSNPSGTDPFNPASNVIPGQSGALTGDSSVTPLTGTNANYNFAIARVRLRGSQGPAGEAANVRVFFRLWVTQTVDTDFQTATYPSHNDAAGLPDWPLPASASQTIPFFATSNTPNFTNANNPEYGTNGVNNQLIVINSGDSVWTYFGCFLNVYDPANVVNGSPVRNQLGGTHHCLVAQIAYDGAPIINSNGVTENPGNSDKLAQRNLQVSPSDNPGRFDSHLVPQTMDLRPSLPPIMGEDVLLQYPDELMIDWGNIPAGTKAAIYWPQVNAASVLQLASRLYGGHALSMSDANTVVCDVTQGITYVPIPPGTGANFAGLFTLDLPPGVRKGQEFNAIVRRIATRRFQPVLEAPIAFRNKPQPRQLRDTQPLAAQAINWRYVTGTFQVKIPIAEARALLPAEENTLAILKWRLASMAPANRWYPVLQRYIDQVSIRVSSFGGDPAAILPSPEGYTATPITNCKSWSRSTALLLCALVVSLGSLTGSWLAILSASLAALTVIAEAVWVVRCRPGVCRWLRNVFTGGLLGALVLALLILFGISAPQAVAILCIVVIFLTMAMFVEFLKKCH
jgi:hypothetical protein